VPCYRSSAVENEKQACIRVLDYIHHNPLLTGLPVVVIIEGAPGLAASYLAGHLNSYAALLQIQLHYMYEITAEPNAPGVLKNAFTRDRYRLVLEEALQNNRLCWINGVGSIHPKNTGVDEIDRLTQSMLAYHYDEKTGKIDAKGENPDDILSAFVQMLYWLGIFWSSPRYVLVREHIITRSQKNYPFITSAVIATLNLMKKTHSRR
jgi:hypothetical protein